MKLLVVKRQLLLNPALIMWLLKFLDLILKNSRKADPRLTTQMKSVGEVMAIGRTFQESLQKAIRGLEIGRYGLEPKLI